ncbi:MAG: SET domain-containing protein [Candidatus Diapherotrites archaeon]|nr:SET domain-containing protein [Candidatus Diapherotrites archaeon]
MAKKITIKESIKGKSLFAAQEIAKGEIIFAFERHFTGTRTKTSMQIGENLHQESTDPDSAENFINHSCGPNAFVEFSDLTLRALQTILPDEEITLNYCTTEWVSAAPFQCKCGSKNCIGYFSGFSFLSKEQQKKLEPLVSPFIKKKLAKN